MRMKIRMKIEAFMKWVQRWEFLITLLLGIFLGLGLTASMELIPKEFKSYAIVLFLVILFVVALVLVVANIDYKYREIQTSRAFYSPFTLQKWENRVTILNKEGSANVQATRVLTAEEGEDIPSIKLCFWSDSAGNENDIEHTGTKVNGEDVDINPDNITTETMSRGDQIYKNLSINVPTLNKVSPSVEIFCDLVYPIGAFKKAFLKNEEETFSAKIYHPTRLLKIMIELNNKLPKEEYKFDQPSFEVHDFNGNKVGLVEEMIKREKAYPVSNHRKLVWEITNPKVGLNYILKFKIFTLKL
jgi:hypothetical protein